MKRTIILITLVLFLLAGCSQKPAKIVETVTTNWATYYSMSDGTWQKDGITYKYRLEISGRMPNAARDSNFTYLSNRRNITFEQAWKAQFSSNTKDFFSAEEAVLIDIE